MTIKQTDMDVILKKGKFVYYLVFGTVVLMWMYASLWAFLSIGLFVLDYSTAGTAVGICIKWFIIGLVGIFIINIYKPSGVYATAKKEHKGKITPDVFEIYYRQRIAIQEKYETNNPKMVAWDAKNRERITKNKEQYNMIFRKLGLK